MKQGVAVSGCIEESWVGKHHWMLLGGIPALGRALDPIGCFDKHIRGTSGVLGSGGVGMKVVKLLALCKVVN